MNDTTFTLEWQDGGWVLMCNGKPADNHGPRDHRTAQVALIDAITHLAEQRPAKVEAA